MTTATRNIRVVVADDNNGTRLNLERLLGIEPGFEVIGVADDGRAAVDLAEQVGPDVVLIDVNLPELDGIAATAEIRRRSPGTAVVVMSVEDQFLYLRPAMIAGASDFLTKPFSVEELTTSVRRAFERAALTPRASGGPGVPVSVVTPTALGKVIAVFSPKGGAGRTTIAVNLAAAIRSETGRSVLLIDANLVFGDVGAMLNLTPTRTIIDLLPHCAKLNSYTLSQFLVEHPTGLKALLAPPRPEMAEIVQVEQMRAIVEQARRSFDYVVIDTPTSFDEVNLTALDAADHILVVSTLEVPMLKNLKMLLETAQALGYPAEKTIILANRADSSGAIRVEDVEESLQKPIEVSIANDWRLATAAANEGVPFVIGARDSQIARDVLALGRLMTGTPASASPARKQKRRLKLLKFAFG